MNAQRPIHRLFLFLLLLLVLPAALQAAEREVVRSFDLGENGRISLSNVNGDVTIEAREGREVKVRALITGGRESSVERTEVRFDRRGSHLDIETELPNERGGWIGSSHGHTSVEYRLEVPAEIELSEISLVNGSLELDGVRGEVEVSLVNGALEARNLGGDADLSTVNGSIDARFDRLGGSQRLEIASVNGSIELHVPEDADAEIEAETVHGRIRNDFGLEVEKDRWVGSELRGRLGTGSARVSLENVNGSIEIRRN